MSDTQEVLNLVAQWGGVSWRWLAGPFWAFMNAPFIAGLVPAFVGILLTRRVAEVAQTNKDLEAQRSAEAQVHEIDRQDVLELTLPVQVTPDAQESTFGSAPAAAASQSLPPPERVEMLDSKIDALKVEINHRIAELDGRRRRKYVNVQRYDYRPIILMLAQDKAITDDESYALIDIFTVWNAFRKKKPTLPAEKAEQILSFRLSRPHRRSQSNQRQKQPKDQELESPPDHGPQ